MQILSCVTQVFVSEFTVKKQTPTTTTTTTVAIWIFFLESGHVRNQKFTSYWTISKAEVPYTIAWIDTT